MNLDELPALQGDYALEVNKPNAAGGLWEGDHVIVREATEAPDGALVVAKAEGGYTIRRAPLDPAEGVAVVGLVVGLVRDLTGGER